MEETKRALQESDSSADEGADQLNRRLAFLELGPEDAARLRSLGPEFRACVDEFVEQFYRHLYAFEETAQFLGDANLVARLKQAQRAHLESMLDAVWDEDYAAGRQRVGRVHAREGIEPEWFLGSFNHYLQFWLGQFEAQSDETERAHLAVVGSLVRAVLFDIGLTLDAYFQESTRQLRQALNLYWQANAELRQFAQLASHDLKTPLATVANLCDEALDEFGEEMPAGAIELLEKSKQRIYRMSSTIDELLASTVHAAEPDSGQHVDSRRMIDEAIEEVRPILDRKGVKLSISGEFPAVAADRARLREILANLLSNAAKFIDKLPGRIELTGAVHENEWVLAVEDNGTGIPPEERERIFSPFRRLRGHQHIPGSGLGLYFAKSLVQQLHGRIWVESDLGQGSCFRVALPLAIK